MEVTFSWKYGGENVQFACSANNWSIMDMVKAAHSNYWHCTMVLNSGVHEYKFLVDGVWCHDIEKPTSDDKHGGKNNIIEINFENIRMFF